eukprot:COSAG05_NODE_520_length_9047_cov_2.500224_7_plen_104_part_00
MADIMRMHAVRQVWSKPMPSHHFGQQREIALAREELWQVVKPGNRHYPSLHEAVDDDGNDSSTTQAEREEEQRAPEEEGWLYCVASGRRMSRTSTLSLATCLI